MDLADPDPENLYLPATCNESEDKTAVAEELATSDSDESEGTIDGLGVIWSLEWSWISGMQGSSVKEIFSHAFAENKDVALLAFTGWTVWNRRNQLRFKESACPLD
ncbi:hypothetical protein SO802_022742 [Lithocarpus litseifolius]|uniref:Uncharacterized protein n=1 Tax=Lithocarpus litseifolius TaxID=425828 RepID=A0AAW2C4A3_9ROSI